MSFVVFGKNNCPFCEKAKELLRNKEQKFVYKNVLEKEDTLLEMLQMVKDMGGSKPRTVPQIFIDNHYIGGYSELVEYFNHPEEINPSDYIGEL